METNTNINEIEHINQIPVRDIVLQNVRAAELFEKYNIDFCCKGKRPLEEALKEKGMDINRFMDELSNTIGNREVAGEHPEDWDLTFLSQYIVNNHHSYVRRAIPSISSHLDKVVSKHGDKYNYLASLRNEFQVLADELMSHMYKEERILFPLIKYLEDSKKFNEKPKTGGFSTIKNPIMKMESEHMSAGTVLENIRSITNNYSLPGDACTTFKLSHSELIDFEKDLHRHIHLENNILFPKAIKLEEDLLYPAFDK